MSTFFDCYVCKKPNCKQRCSKCKGNFYCSKECQKSDWPRHKEDCGELASELRRLETFVKQNPYPSYEELSKKVNMILLAEYGEINHEWCKELYENITNSIKVYEIGQNINKRGDFQTMQANYRIMRDYGPTSKSRDACVFACWSPWVEHVWDGIGDWKA